MVYDFIYSVIFFVFAARFWYCSDKVKMLTIMLNFMSSLGQTLYGSDDRGNPIEISADEVETVVKKDKFYYLLHSVISAIMCVVCIVWFVLRFIL